MSGRFSLPILLLVLGLLLVAAAYVLVLVGAAEPAPWLMAAGSSLALTALGLLGVGPRRPCLSAAVLVACASTFAGLAIGLAMSPPTADGPLLLGLPRVTALLLLFTGAVPLVLLPIAYGVFFRREVLRDDE
jgi:hypothetical protein